MGKGLSRRIPLLLIFGFIFLATFISAQPFTQLSDTGLVITSPKFESIQAGQGFNLTVHVFNQTTGLRVSGSTATCFGELYNMSGSHHIDDAMLVPINNEYYYHISAGNFTNIKSFSYNVYCNSSSMGGFADGLIYVTYNGEILDVPRAVLYVILISVMILLFIGVFFGIGLLPNSNKTDDDGRIIKVNWLKYLRPALWFVEWMIFIAILYLSSNLAFAYLTEQMFAKTLFVIFRICFSLTPVILVVWIVWIFAKMFHDREFQNMLNRGIFPQGKL